MDESDVLRHSHDSSQVQMQDVNLLSLVHFAVNALNVEHGKQWLFSP